MAQAPVDGFRSRTVFASGVTYSSTVPTPVPFGVSADLGILILGGIFGASRLRKTLAARKQISNSEA